MIWGGELEGIEGKILIYGAHLVALECFRFLIYKGKESSITGFAVTNRSGNPEEIEGYPVKEIGEYQDLRHVVTVIIAMPKKYHAAVENHAREKGFQKFIQVSLEEMSLIKREQLLWEQRSRIGFPFVLEKSGRDGSWLDIRRQREETVRYYKFPTLFYRNMDDVFEETENLAFQKDYQKVLGSYRNIHCMPEKEREEIGKPYTEALQVYMIFSRGDSALLSADSAYESWIRPLQVGGRESKMKISCQYDDVGDSIADKNHLFAEMTGAYWIWKNVDQVCYKGLCHYRRHFVISEDEIRRLEQNKMDVILTIPRYVPYGVGNMFLAETPVKAQVFETMVQAIRKCAPEDEIDFKNYMRACFYYPNNMVIARNDIYNAYCEWVFRILFRMLEIEEEKDYGHADDRHLAYAAELLTSFYFVKNKDNYRIAVTEYQFYK